MLFAEIQSVSFAESLGTVLHQIFGGDFPDEPLAVGQVVARAVFVYVVTLLIVRVGKSRIISRATTLDVILGFILGSLISRAVTGKASISGTLAGAIAMVATHWLLTAMACRWHFFGDLMKGNSYLVVKDGQPLATPMRHSHISSHDLIEEMRLAGIAELNEVHEAYKERNGEVSFLKQKSPPRVLEVAVKDGVQTVRIALE